MTESAMPEANRGRLLRLASAASLTVLLVGALAVSWTIPFQEWDAYSIGIWSRYISEGDPILSPQVDQIAHQRPLVPVPQGLIWRWLGHPSMRAGRMLSLFFSVLLVFVTFQLARRLKSDRTTAWIAAFLAGSSPLLTEKVSSTLSDIPSAALFWAGILTLFAARAGGGERLILWLCTGVLWALSSLGKVTALPLCAGFAATTIIYGIRQRWRRGAWLAMAIGLGLPAYGVYAYWNVVRSPLSWATFLYGWNVPYYGQLARSSRGPALAHFNWFGISLTLIFIVALVSGLSKHSRIATSFLLAAAGGWAITARLSSSLSLRRYDSGLLDGLIAGVPTIIAVVLAALALSRSRAESFGRKDGELLLAAVSYFALWVMSFGYDRRFLIAILPPIAVCASRWLRSAGEFTQGRRSPVLVAAMVFIYSGAAWEGARLMDRGYPAFSRAMLSINHRNGLSPEKKMAEIFGPNMRIIGKAEEMVRADPRLRIVSPDTRLPFFFGTRLDAHYPTPSNIANYDLLIWVNNSGILEYYRMVYKIPEPLDALKKAVPLLELDKSAEYELYKIQK